MIASPLGSGTPQLSVVVEQPLKSAAKLSVRLKRTNVLLELPREQVPIPFGVLSSFIRRSVLLNFSPTHAAAHQSDDEGHNPRRELFNH